MRLRTESVQGCETVQANIASAGGCVGLAADALAACPRRDILVNSAGNARIATAAGLSVADRGRTVAANMKAPSLRFGGARSEAWTARFRSAAIGPGTCRTAAFWSDPMAYRFVRNVEGAFRRYEEVRHRLPRADFPRESRECSGLVEIADQFDAALLDSFGVLNVGDEPLPGARECLAVLRSMGKRLIVLTNAASHPHRAAVERYRRLGFDFAPEEVVSSRDVCARRLNAVPSVDCWGAVAVRGDEFEDIDAEIVHWDASSRKNVDGFLLLSTADLDPEELDALEAEQRANPRPLVVANPDLVAPRQGGLSKEPGYCAHGLADRLGLVPEFFGKPYRDAFSDALSRLDGFARDRILMVGDTLHTDILGGGPLPVSGRSLSRTADCSRAHAFARFLRRQESFRISNAPRSEM